MLPSKDVMQLENQRFYMSNGMPVSRQVNNKSQSEVNSQANLMQGVNPHVPVSNSSGQCSTQNSSPSVYNGFYSSSTFNSINNFEASLQWLTENRIPNNGLLSDKNLNCSSHSTPSHSCCVNRLGMESVGMCSPLSGDSYRSSRDTLNFQTKPPALSVNVIDSVQNWFNLPPLPNQQYSSKYNDQTMNCAQAGLPVIEQSDLKQNDICLQMSDSYFEPTLNNNLNNAKHSNGNNMGDINGKIPDINESSVMKGFNNSYQTNLRDSWKQPLQTAASYISSPTLFNSLNESPEHYLYSLPPPSTSAASYCMVSENTNCKVTQSSCNQQSVFDKQITNSRLMSCGEQHNQMKTTSQSHIHHIEHNISNNHNSMNTITDKSIQGLHNSSNAKIKGAKHISNQDTATCENSKFNENANHFSSVFMSSGNSIVVHDRDVLVNRKDGDSISKDTENSVIEITDETTSGSDESNIIVEESDMEEIDSMISADDVKKSYLSEKPVELRCLICNVKSSSQTPATQFIHMNDSFPLTTASKMPVASKLIQILPSDLQHFLKLHNSFMCRRCLNLVETVEVLEVKLTSVKQTLSENFSKTVQYFLPATPIVEIENGTAKIIDKEIISCIEESREVISSYAENSKPTRELQKESIDVGSIDRTDETEDEFSGVSEDDNSEVCTEDGENSCKENEEKSTYDNLQCSICSKVLSNPCYYKKHMQLHTKNFSYYCEFCGKGFAFKRSLDKHVKSHVDDCRYQCDKCGKTYSQKHRLDNHLKRHSGEFKVCCEVCGKGFMERAAFDMHVKSHTKDRQCVCEICGSKFSKPSNLKAHLQLCKKEEIKCDQCAQTFHSKTHLKRHKIVDHDGKPNATCEVCGKHFVNFKELKPHMRTHSDEKPFECKLCGKRYKYVSNLNQHAKIHDIDKQIKCSLCDQMFCRKGLLDDHMNTHTRDHVYRCSECGKEFYEQKNFQKHLRKHSNSVKLKPCPICGKKLRDGLEVHMRTHSGVKPYVCCHCGLAFSVHRSLARHIEAKHSNMLET